MRNKFVRLLLSVLVAMGLWYYVITFVSPNWENTYYDVPVSLAGANALTERQLMLISDTNQTVSLTLAGTRQDLGRINKSNLTLVADLTSIWEAGTYQLHYDIIYPGDVPAGAVSCMIRDPNTVNVVVADRVTEEIPVLVFYSGSVPEDFIMDRNTQVLDYEYIQVTGPRETVEKIDHASIYVDCEGRTESISESYPFVLEDADGNPVDAKWITTKVDQVRLELTISRLKKLPLVLTVIYGAGATEETSKIVIDPLEITVSGSDTALAKLDELNIGTLNLADVQGTVTEREFEIVLPEGITNRSGVTTAKVSIRFPDLAKRELTVTNFNLINIPEGMDVEILTKQLVVTVRGPKLLVQKLRLEDITVTIDLAEVENTAAVVPEISFSSTFEELGALGKYSVSVSLTPTPAPVEEP